MQDTPTFDWRTISALNAVSALAQVGQFGVAYVMLPVWLVAQGFDASQVGLFAASLWLGQLPGLGLAPRLCQMLGERRVVVLGLLCTLCAFAWIPGAGWPWSWLGGCLAGFGLGLRWIGVEPWLYGIAPAHSRGRLVGFHETLIAFAPIVAPLLVAYFGVHGNALFWIGGLFMVASLLPLALTRAPVRVLAAPLSHASWRSRLRGAREPVFKQGLVIALVGGMMEATVSGLFAVFTQDHGMSVSQTAELLAVFGVGGLLLQYGVGWFADHRGVAQTALWCALGTVAVCMALLSPMPSPLVTAAVFLLGGFITAFLTLALVAATTSSTGTMAGNVSTMSMVYTLSAVGGPLAAGAIIQASNGDALMWLTAGAAVLMACLLLSLKPLHQQSTGSKLQ
ncbi:MAG: MFS transporter [Rhodoferax sp.]